MIFPVTGDGLDPLCKGTRKGAHNGTCKGTTDGESKGTTNGRSKGTHKGTREGTTKGKSNGTTEGNKARVIDRTSSSTVWGTITHNHNHNPSNFPNTMMMSTTNR